jgi:F-type H+-transporting ATPase subunit epsilon
MAACECTVSSPVGVVFRGEIASVVVPAVDGELCILPRHAPLLASLGFGELRVKRARSEGAGSPSGGLERYFVDGGFVQVLKNHVTVLAASVEPLASLEASRLTEALEALSRERPPGHCTAEEWQAYEKAVELTRKKIRLARARG